MGTDFPARSAGVKKNSSLCSSQGMAFVGMGQSSRVFFRGRRSRDRFLLMKYNGAVFSPLGCHVYPFFPCRHVAAWAVWRVCCRSGEYNDGELPHRGSARTRDVDVQRCFPVKPAAAWGANCLDEYSSCSSGPRGLGFGVNMPNRPSLSKRKNKAKVYFTSSNYHQSLVFLLQL